MGFSRNLAVTLEHEVRWLMNFHTTCQVQHDGVRLMFTAFIYWVWCARNDKFSNGNAYTVNNQSQQIRDKVHIKMQANQYKMPKGQVRMVDHDCSKNLSVERVWWNKTIGGDEEA